MGFFNLVRGIFYPSSNVVLKPSVTGNVEGGSGDTTKRITLMTEQQTTKAEPFGDLLRFVALHGRAKGGLKIYEAGTSASIISTTPQVSTTNSNNVSGLTLQVSVDGGSTQTVTFPTGTVSGVDYTAATARQVANYLAANITGAQAREYVIDEFSRIEIRSDTYGTGSSVFVTGGTAGSVLGFTNTASSVTAASSITLPNTTNRVFPITGSTTINEISPSGWSRYDVVALSLPSGATLKHKGVASSAIAGVSGPMVLQDNVDLVTTQTMIVLFRYDRDLSDSGDGNYCWREISRNRGSAGIIDLGGDVLGREVAWVIGHQAPNNLTSATWHNHISFETTDTKGEAQTRLGIYYGRDTSIVMVTSSQFMVHENPIILSGDDTSTKQIWFSTDNTGQQKSRRASIQTETSANDHDLTFRVHDNNGTATELLRFKRTAKALNLSCAIQTKVRSSAIAASSVITATVQNGNVFVISGTGTINYMANTDIIAGCEYTFIFQAAATITNNAGSPTSTNRPFQLQGSANKTLGANGGSAKFIYDGSGYTNKWVQVTPWVEY